MSPRQAPSMGVSLNCVGGLKLQPSPGYRISLWCMPLQATRTYRHKGRFNSALKSPHILLQPCDPNPDLLSSSAQTSTPHHSMLQSDGLSSRTMYHLLFYSLRFGFRRCHCHLFSDFLGDGELQVHMAVKASVPCPSTKEMPINIYDSVV